MTRSAISAPRHINFFLLYIILLLFSTTNALGVVYLDLAGGGGVATLKGETNGTLQILPVKGAGGVEFGEGARLGCGVVYLWSTVLMKHLGRSYGGVLKGYGLEGVLTLAIGESIALRFSGSYLMQNSLVIQTQSTNRINGLEIIQESLTDYKGGTPILGQVSLQWKQKESKVKGRDSILTGVGVELGTATYPRVKKSYSSNNATVSPVSAREEIEATGLIYGALMMHVGYGF